MPATGLGLALIAAVALHVEEVSGSLDLTKGEVAIHVARALERQTGSAPVINHLGEAGRCAGDFRCEDEIRDRTKADTLIFVRVTRSKKKVQVSLEVAKDEDRKRVAIVVPSDPEAWADPLDGAMERIFGQGSTVREPLPTDADPSSRGATVRLTGKKARKVPKGSQRGDRFEPLDLPPLVEEQDLDTGRKVKPVARKRGGRPLSE